MYVIDVCNICYVCMYVCMYVEGVKQNDDIRMRILSTGHSLLLLQAGHIVCMNSMWRYVLLFLLRFEKST